MEKAPTEEFLRNIDVHTLLPQQEPFVMIDTLIAYDESHTVSEMVIKADNIFVDWSAADKSDGMFSPSGLIENIAQTCAARIGYVNKYILKQGIQLGFIGSVKNLNIMKRPKVGDRITTSVTIKDELYGVTLASAEVTCNGETLVTTDMQIAVREG